MAENEVNIVVNGEDKASPALKKAADGGKGLIGVFGDVAKGLAVFELASGGFAKLAGAAEAFIGKASEVGGEVAKLKREFGGTAEDASRLRFQFEETGVSFESGEKGLKKFSQALAGIADTADGVTIPVGKQMKTLLRELGVQAEDATGNTLPMIDVMGNLADKFQSMPDGAEKTATAMKLFGKAGTDLIPMLNKGRLGLAELSKESDKLGLTLNQKTLDALKKQKVAMREMSAAIDGVKVQIGVALIPLMTKATVVVADLAKTFNEKAIPVIQSLAAWLGDRLAPVFEKIQRVVSTFADLIGSALSGDIESAASAFNRLPGPLQAVAIVMALVYEVGLQVWQALKDLAEIGKMVVGFLDELRGKFEGLIPGSKSVTEQLVKLGDQKDAIHGIALAITAMIAAMAVKVMLNFAAALAETAFSFIQFPLKLVNAAAGEVAGFVKAVAGLVSKAVDITMNVIGTAADIAQAIAGFAGKVVTVTINAVGNAIQFLSGLVNGALQKLVNALPPLQIPVQLKSESGAMNFQSSGKEAGSSWLAGFKSQINAQNISNAVSGVIGGVLGALITAELAATIGTAMVAVASAAAVIFAQTFAIRWVYEAKGLGGVIGMVLGEILGGALFGPIGLVMGGAIGAMFTDIISRVPDMLAPLPAAIGEGIGRAAVIILTLPFVVIAGLVRGFQIVGPQIVNAVSDVGGKIVDGISSGISASIPKITAAFSIAFDPQTYIGIARFMIEQIALTIADPSRILTAIEKLGDWLKTGFEKVADLAVEAFFTGLDGLKRAATFVLDLVERIFGDFFSGLVDGARKQWDDVNKLTDGALNDFVGFVRDGLSRAFDVVVYIGAAIINWFVELPDRIQRALYSLASSMFDIGRSIVWGLMDGINSVLGDLWSKLAEIAEAIKKAFKNPLKILSPSKVFHEIGSQLMAGLTNGIDASSGAASSAMGRVAGGLPGMLTPGVGSATSGYGDASRMRGQGVEVHFNGPVTIQAQDEAAAERSTSSVGWAIAQGMRARGVWAT